MTRPFELHVHSEIRELIPEPQLSALARRTLSDIDMVINSEDVAFKHTRMLTAEGKDGKTIPVKFVIARGTGFDAIHLTVPKSMQQKIANCSACGGVGYANPQRNQICTQCQGLGYSPVTNTAPL